jgi:outer membrane receptor protein involved in Fe transport
MNIKPFRRKFLPAIISSVAISFGAANTFADSLMLEEVVVTAQKRAQNVQDVPIAITAFGGQRLEELGVVDLSGLSNSAPNVNLDNSTPFGASQAILTAYIRGIGSDDFAFNIDPGVGVYVDGVYLARSVGANQSLLDVERIEILKGPQGTLFGRNTIGGAISVVTRDPSEEFGGKVEITYGSDNLVQARGIVEGSLTDSMTASLSASHRSRDGYLERVAFPGNGTPATADQTLFPYSGYSSGDKEGEEDTQTIRAKLKFEGSRFTARFSADYTQDQSSQASSLIQTSAGFAPGTTTLGDTVLPDLGGESLFPGFGPFLDLTAGGPGDGLDGLFFGSLYNYCLSQTGPGASAIPPLQGGIAALCGTRGQVGSSLQIDTPLFGNPNGAAYYTDNFISDDIDKTYSTGPNFSDLEFYGFSAVVDFDLTDTLTLKSISSYRDQTWSAGMDLDGSPLNILTTTFEQEQQQFSEELQLLGTGLADGALDFVLGVYYFHEEGDLQDLVMFTEGLLYVDGFNSFDTNNWAVFGQIEYQLSEEFTLLIGGRYTEEEKEFEGGQRDLNGGNYRNFPFCVGANGYPDPDAIIPPIPGLPGGGSACRDGVPPVPYYDADTFRVYEPGVQKQSFSNFSPKIGLQYFPSDDVQFFATYSKGYKTGGWTTRLQNPLPASETEFNEEIATTMELGVKSQLFSNSTQVNLSLFKTDYEDIQLNFQRGTSPTLKNAGDADILGFEADIQTILTENFSLQATLGWLDTELSNVDDEVVIASGPNHFQEGVVVGAELPKASGWQASLAPRFETDLESGLFSVQASITYASEAQNQVERVNVLKRDSVVMGDLIATLAMNNDVTVAVGVKNLSDERYLVTGNANASAGSFSGTYNRGREWFLTLGYEF